MANKAMKPTVRQMVVLKELSKKGAEANWMPYMGRLGGAYWYISGTAYQRVTREIDGLKKRGLVDVVSKDRFGDSRTAKINANGRAALKDYQKDA